MTTPPQNPFEHNPFGATPFGSVPSGPPVYAAPVPPPDRPPVNALATLSVVFAFVFAPVGAVLGHLGLRQIRRTGQRGRDRALVGTVLSYVVIAVVVGVLVVWLTRPDSSPRQSAAPSTTTTTTAHPTVAPPAVSPSDLPGLIPSLDDAKTITGDQTLAFDGEEHAPHQAEETLDRPECRGALEVAAPEAYKGNTLLGFYMPRYAKLGDPANVIAMDPAVAAFFDDATAQTQLQNLLSVFRQCGGTSVKADKPDKTFTFSVSRPTDVGNGITTLEITTPWALNVHAIAAKANVVMDLLVTYTGNGVDRARGTALDVANRILNRIPG